MSIKYDALRNRSDNNDDDCDNERTDVVLNSEHIIQNTDSGNNRKKKINPDAKFRLI